MQCIHFIGCVHPDQGKDARYDNARKVWGEPDFVHRRWDVRAMQEIAPGDVAVFFKDDPDSEPNVNAFDDSAVMCDPRVVGPEDATDADCFTPEELAALPRAGRVLVVGS